MKEGLHRVLRDGADVVVSATSATRAASAPPHSSRRGERERALTPLRSAAPLPGGLKAA
jgi:hypothetical protein